MDILELMKDISKPSPTKIVLVVMDGLGGLPDPKTGKTELETAKTPNLDRLAAEGNCGLTDPVSPGITPGSTPGHLALFGFDPVTYNIGRGALEAIGIDFNLQLEDVVARGNFCTVDQSGIITDRRAGRISSEKCAELSRLLDGLKIENVQLIVRPVKEHRFIAVFRGEGLASDVTDSDPQQVGLKPKEIIPMSLPAKRMAEIANRFASKAKEILSKHHPANMIVLRGFSKRPLFPSMNDIYKVRAAAIATYPMYRGLAKLIGMEVLDAGATIEDEFATLKRHYQDFDYFFLHVKATDAAGEDGDFARKVKIMEQVDSAISGLIALKVDVIVVTGDHSTPAVLRGHSWHPVPLLIHSRWCRPDRLKKFSESACGSGSLGRLPAIHVMPLAMANALKLEKYGA